MLVIRLTSLYQSSLIWTSGSILLGDGQHSQAEKTGRGEKSWAREPNTVDDSGSGDSQPTGRTSDAWLRGKRDARGSQDSGLGAGVTSADLLFPRQVDEAQTDPR